MWVKNGGSPDLLKHKRPASQDVHCFQEGIIF